MTETKGRKSFKNRKQMAEQTAEQKSDIMRSYMNLLYLAVKTSLGIFMRKKYMK